MSRRAAAVPAPSDDVEAARRAWQAMRALVLDRNDRRAQLTARFGMSFVRIKAVGRWSRARLTMCELAAALAVDASYATVVVDDLEARGLAERRTDTDDRRRKIVLLTAAGLRVARQAAKLLDDPPAGLGELPPDDLAHLDRIMQSLLDLDG